MKNVKGVFCGSGSDGMNDARLAECILKMCRTTEEKPTTVLYLGTATYDLPRFATRQTERFREKGCTIATLELVDQAPSPSEIQASIEQADVIVVGGGNTLFAVDRWTKLGVVDHLRQSSAILTGGSAGAICWFDGGHSDSMDPDTYKIPMLKKHGGAAAAEAVADESSTLTETKKDWKYIRINGLGMFHGLMCPHHDRVQSNGVLRANDFDEMMLKHPGEVGIGLDHWAALVAEGDDNYSVLSLEGKPGSVLYGADGAPSFSPEAKGVPGIWIKRVVEKEDGSKTVESRLCPPKGKLSDILKPASEILEDTEDMQRCRRDNPDGGPFHS